MGTSVGVSLGHFRQLSLRGADVSLSRWDFIRLAQIFALIVTFSSSAQFHL